MLSVLLWQWLPMFAFAGRSDLGEVMEAEVGLYVNMY
jgi:hypothetical protein